MIFNDHDLHTIILSSSIISVLRLLMLLVLFCLDPRSDDGFWGSNKESFLPLLQARYRQFWTIPNWCNSVFKYWDPTSESRVQMCILQHFLGYFMGGSRQVKWYCVRMCQGLCLPQFLHGTLSPHTYAFIVVSTKIQQSETHTQIINLLVISPRNHRNCPELRLWCSIHPNSQKFWHYTTACKLRQHPEWRELLGT